MLKFYIKHASPVDTGTEKIWIPGLLMTIIQGKQLKNYKTTMHCKAFSNAFKLIPKLCNFAQ